MLSVEKYREVITMLAELYEHAISKDVARLYYETFKGFSDEQFEAMATLHIKDPDCGRYFPKPAHLLAKLPKGPQHPVADIAWGIAVQSYDESHTVVWTEQIKQAREAAKAIWEMGDMIGACLAFKAAYSAILTALPAGSIPRWELSPGTNQQARIAAITNAQAQGLIGKAQAQRLLPHYISPEFDAAPEVKDALRLLSSGEVIQSPKSPQLADRWSTAIAEGHKRAAQQRMQQKQEQESAKAREVAELTAKIKVAVRAELISEQQEAAAQALLTKHSKKRGTA